MPREESAVSGAAGPVVDSEETVLGLDNVALSLPVAGIGSRILAGLLDYLIQFMLQIVWLIVVGGVIVFGGGKGLWRAVLYLAGVFVIDWGYFAGSEILLSQQTPGKKALRLRVVTREGGTPSTASLMIRNLVRIADLVVGVPLIAIDPLARRLGDRLAGTLVVHDVDRPAHVLGRIPSGWSAPEIAVVESLFERAGEMEPARVERLSERLLDSLKQQHPEFLAGIEPGSTALETLRRVFHAGIT